jgi:hypothetical protein
LNALQLKYDLLLIFNLSIDLSNSDFPGPFFFAALDIEGGARVVLVKEEMLPELEVVDHGFSLKT